MKNVFCRGKVKEKHTYTITIFSTDDRVMAQGALTHTNAQSAGLVLQTAEDLDIIHTGTLGHGVVKQNGEARWLMPREAITLDVPTRNLFTEQSLRLTLEVRDQ